MGRSNIEDSTLGPGSGSGSSCSITDRIHGHPLIQGLRDSAGGLPPRPHPPSFVSGRKELKDRGPSAQCLCVAASPEGWKAGSQSAAEGLGAWEGRGGRAGGVFLCSCLFTCEALARRRSSPGSGWRRGAGDAPSDPPGRRRRLQARRDRPRRSRALPGKFAESPGSCAAGAAAARESGTRATLRGAQPRGFRPPLAQAPCGPGRQATRWGKKNLKV